jgi:hypothetical protein
MAAISQHQIDVIMERFAMLHGRFQSLPEGGHLELEFP